MPVRLVSSVARPPVPPPPQRPMLRVVSHEADPPPSAADAVPRACDRPMAFLLDEPWPEYTDLVRHHVLPGDVMAVPMQGLGPLHGPSWPTPTGVHVHACSLLSHLRRQELEDQTLPAARVRTRQKYDGLLARAYAGVLAPRMDHLVVAQSLLPHLQEAGVLKRRTYDVLMSRLPYAELNRRVRLVQARHPTNAMLYLHVTDSTLADLETEALRGARRIFTPHAEVADLMGHRSVRLPWVLPQVRASSGRARVLYPGASTALEGAYEVRAAARATGLTISLVMEGGRAPGFWRGVRVEERPADSWLTEGSVVVQPAWTLARPHRLLEALAAGLRVVATPGCGLPPPSLAEELRMGHVEDVLSALRPLVTAHAPG